MIVLDTHIWIWWVVDSDRLAPTSRELLDHPAGGRLGVSVISCWEVAKLVELQRLQLTLPVAEWINSAPAYPGVQLLPLTPQLAVASTELPPGLHRDPADQIIVATARQYDAPLMTADAKILRYPHVKTLAA